MTWLHDLDTLQSLSTEPGPIGQWARFQCAVRGVDAVLPTRLMYRGVVALLRPPSFEPWFLEQLDDPTFLIELEHAVAHGVLPADVGPWIDACRSGLSGPSAEAAANTLLRLGVGLSQIELAQAAAAAPEALTLPAWIVSVDASASQQVAEETPLDQLLASIALLLPCVVPDESDALAALRAGAERARVLLEPEGRGAVRRRVQRLISPLARGAVGALIEGAMEADRSLPAQITHGVALLAGSVEVSALERYRRGLFDPEAIAAARIERCAALEAGVAIELGVLPPVVPESVYAQQALAARCGAWVVEVLTQHQTRHVGFELARFAQTEAVLEVLFDQAVPADPDAALSLAVALIHTGVPTVMSRIRQLADGLDDDSVGFLAQEASSFYREAL